MISDGFFSSFFCHSSALAEILSPKPSYQFILIFMFYFNQEKLNKLQTRERRMKKQIKLNKISSSSFFCFRFYVSAVVVVVAISVLEIYCNPFVSVFIWLFGFLFCFSSVHTLVSPSEPDVRCSTNSDFILFILLPFPRAFVYSKWLHLVELCALF